MVVEVCNIEIISRKIKAVFSNCKEEIDGGVYACSRFIQRCKDVLDCAIGTNYTIIIEY